MVKVIILDLHSRMAGFESVKFYSQVALMSVALSYYRLFYPKDEPLYYTPASNFSYLGWFCLWPYGEAGINNTYFIINK